MATKMDLILHNACFPVSKSPALAAEVGALTLTQVFSVGTEGGGGKLRVNLFKM